MNSTTDQTLTQTEEWTAPGLLDAVRAELLAAAEDHGAKVLVAEARASGGEVHLGSFSP